MAKRLTLAIGVLLVVAALAAWAKPQASSVQQLQASGVVEADEIQVSSEVQGEILEITVEEGDPVVAGEALVVLSNLEVEYGVRQAESGVETARAELAVFQSLPRTEAVTAARAAVTASEAQREQARATHVAAMGAYQDLLDLGQRVLEAEGQLALARAAVDSASARAARARYQADHGEWNSTERRVLESQARAAAEALTAAQVDAQAAEVALEHLKAMRQNPVAYFAALHLAEGQLEIACQGVRVAQAELEDVLAGSTGKELAVALATVELAAAQQRLAQAQQDRLVIRSPVSGTVVNRVVNAGETALAGAQLVSVADLSVLYLTVYVPQTRIGEVFLGQSVQVGVDCCPQDYFVGNVVHVADEPQYTPRNLATKEERVNTGYAVKVRLENPGGVLKPGMPADATVIEQ